MNRRGSMKAAMIPINGKAITDSLFESMFFGHEKGAFTRADKKSPDYLALADGGTAFLDEAGELSKENQVKLL